MDLTKTEQNLVEAIRACKHLGFYEQVRSNFANLNYQNPTINNSVKATFSRAKKNLLDAGKISETNLLPISLTDEQYVVFAAYVTSSPVIRELRLKLLPKIFEKIAVADEGSRLVRAEKEIYDFGWRQYKYDEIDLKSKKEQLNEIIQKIYIFILPIFSKMDRRPRKYVSGFEDMKLFVALAIFDSMSNRYISREKTYLEIFETFKLDFLHTLDEKVFLLIREYEKMIEEIGSVVLGHKRRIAIGEAIRDHRLLKSWQSRQPNRRGIKWEIEQELKNKKLASVELSAEDFSFMRTEFDSWSYDKLETVLQEVLAIPEVEVSILKEIS